MQFKEISLCWPFSKIFESEFFLEINFRKFLRSFRSFTPFHPVPLLWTLDISNISNMSNVTLLHLAPRCPYPCPEWDFWSCIFLRPSHLFTLPVHHIASFRLPPPPPAVFFIHFCVVVLSFCLFVFRLLWLGSARFLNKKSRTFRTSCMISWWGKLPHKHCPNVRLVCFNLGLWNRFFSNLSFRGFFLCHRGKEQVSTVDGGCVRETVPYSLVWYSAHTFFTFFSPL